MSVVPLPSAETVRKYVDIVWNQGDISFAREMLSDRCWRDDSENPEESLPCFSLVDQMQRLQDVDRGGIEFQIVELIEAGEYVTMR